ncbi:hypothetical protein GGF32_004777 [Allomyces javanicus]|nr:hypothetical protein GGF32_004777 [Allomyces javanicus]
MSPPRPVYSNLATAPASRSILRWSRLISPEPTPPPHARARSRSWSSIPDAAARAVDESKHPAAQWARKVWNDYPHPIRDMATVVGVWIAAIVVNALPPAQRSFNINDLDIQNPLRPETMPEWLVILISLLASSVYMVAAVRTRAFWPVMGLLLATGVATTFSGALKNASGQLRPDFLARCQPAVLTTESNTDLTSPTSMVCTGDAALVRDGRRSFPSGIATLSATALVYTSHFLARQLDALAPGHIEGRGLRLVATSIPATLAAAMSVTRIVDNRSSWLDVLFGFLLGSAVAWFAAASYLGPVALVDWIAAVEAAFAYDPTARAMDMDTPLVSVATPDSAEEPKLRYRLIRVDESDPMTVAELQDAVDMAEGQYLLAFDDDDTSDQDNDDSPTITTPRATHYVVTPRMPPGSSFPRGGDVTPRAIPAADADTTPIPNPDRRTPPRPAAAGTVPRALPTPISHPPITHVASAPTLRSAGLPPTAIPPRRDRPPPARTDPVPPHSAAPTPTPVNPLRDRPRPATTTPTPMTAIPERRVRPRPSTATAVVPPRQQPRGYGTAPARDSRIFLDNPPTANPNWMATYHLELYATAYCLWPEMLPKERIAPLTTTEAQLLGVEAQKAMLLTQLVDTPEAEEAVIQTDFQKARKLELALTKVLDLLTDLAKASKVKEPAMPVDEFGRPWHISLMWTHWPILIINNTVWLSLEEKQRSISDPHEFIVCILQFKGNWPEGTTLATMLIQALSSNIFIDGFNVERILFPEDPDDKTYRRFMEAVTPHHDQSYLDRLTDYLYNQPYPHGENVCWWFSHIHQAANLANSRPSTVMEADLALPVPFLAVEHETSLKLQIVHRMLEVNGFERAKAVEMCYDPAVPARDIVRAHWHQSFAPKQDALVVHEPAAPMHPAKKRSRKVRWTKNKHLFMDDPKNGDGTQGVGGFNVPDWTQ